MFFSSAIFLTVSSLPFATPFYVSQTPLQDSRSIQHQQDISGSPKPQTEHSPPLIDVSSRAPGVLNTIHASLRQFPSSLHHNGLSFFLASVPEGSLFYHGTSGNVTKGKTPVKGMEWLAFEIEHAEMFARPRGRRPGGPGPPGEGPGGGPGERPPPPPFFLEKGWKGKGGVKKGDRKMKESEEGAEQKGYLHIYETKHALNRLLYIDGMSAAKCPLGTLDSTDIILLNNSLASSSSFPTSDKSSISDIWPFDLSSRPKIEENPPTWHPGSDYDRARGLCELAKDWDLQGFVRMEAGFEIILCDFEAHLRLVSANERPTSSSSHPFSKGANRPPPFERRIESNPREKAEKQGEMEGKDVEKNVMDFTDIPGFEYLRALEQRYWGLPAGRMTVDYSRMISGYFYPEINITNPNPQHVELPRYFSSSDASLAQIRNDLDEMLKSTSTKTEINSVSKGEGKETKKTGSIEWQTIADLIVTRYTTRLPYLVLNSTSAPVMLAEVGVLLDVFIDYGNVNLTDSKEKCGQHYLRQVKEQVERSGTRSDGFIYRDLLVVTRTICDVLFDVREVLGAVDSPSAAATSSSSSSSHHTNNDSSTTTAALIKAKQQISDLMKWLDWSTWKDCARCAVDEVCFVAIWPWGGVEDHEKPSCVGLDWRGRDKRGYWNE